MQVSSTPIRVAIACSVSAAALLAQAVAMSAQPTALVRGPYLQRGAPTSVVVRWRTSSPTDSVVRFGRVPGAPTGIVQTASQTTEHAVTLTGLSAHTRYFYAVGSAASTLVGGDLDHSFVTSPTPGARVPTRLWVLGDSGTANLQARQVRDAFLAMARTRAPDLWLMLGDNAYSSGTDAEYQTAVFDMYPSLLRRAVLWPTFGNHDAISADSATQRGPYYDAFTLPAGGESGGVPSGTEAYYSFDYGNLHVVCLDSSESNRTPSGPMLTWLAQDLAANAADWTIAFFHHPPYSKGSHDSDLDVELREMREYALPILEAGGVDLVLAGHSHSYERSYLLTGHYGASSTLSAGSILDSRPGDGDSGGYGKVRGTSGSVYVTAGSSGQLSGGALNHPAMVRAFSQLGSVVIDVDGPRLEMSFIGTSPGEIVDSVVMMTHAPVGRPSAPQMLRAETSDTAVRLKWHAAGGGGRPEQYVIEAGTAPGGSDVAIAATGTLDTVFGAAAPPGRYFARVRAANGAGTSPPSNDVPIEVRTGIHTPPRPPEHLRADVLGAQVALQWTPPPSGAAGFQFEAGGTPGSAALARLQLGLPGLIAGGVPPGVYYVRVRSLGLGGAGAPSAEVQVVVGGVAAPPEPPGTIRPEIQGHTVRLTWAPPGRGSAAVRYVVEAGGSSGEGTVVRVTTADAGTTAVFTAVPSGTYAVRVRGENALGIGLPSLEARVVVP